MIDYIKKPILVYSRPHNTGDLIVINPDIIVACGIDEHNNVFVEVLGKTNARYYAVDNNIKIINEVCRNMYYGCDGEIDYSSLEQLFTEKMNR